MNAPLVFPSVDWTATYEEDIIAAIEAHIAQQRQEAPQSLIHDGIKLDTLVSRYLYSLVMPDKSAQLHYACFKAGLDCNVPLLDRHMRQIIGRITSRRFVGVVATPDRLSEFVPAWRLVRWLKSQFREPAADGGHGRPLLLMAHHPKFVRYFRPLLEALPGTGAYLLPDRLTQQALGIGDEESLAQPLATPRTITRAVRDWRSLCVLVDEIGAALIRHAPRCVLVAEGDAPYHEALALVGRRMGIPVLCLQWGAYPYRTPHLGFRNMSHTAFMSWGRGFSAQLRPFNPGLRFTEVGNHTLAPQALVPEREILFLMQGPDNYTILPEHWQQFMDFTAWTAQAHPCWQVVVRAHPNMPLITEDASRLAAFPNVTLQDALMVPMGRALKSAAIAVTIVSSGILEALAQGVFPFLFNPTTMVPRFQPDLEALGAGIEAKTLERAKAEMTRLLADPDALNQYGPSLASVSREFFAATGPTALDNILSTVKRALAGNI